MHNNNVEMFQKWFQFESRMDKTLGDCMDRLQILEVAKNKVLDRFTSLEAVTDKHDQALKDLAGQLSSLQTQIKLKSMVLRNRSTKQALELPQSQGLQVSTGSRSLMCSWSKSKLIRNFLTLTKSKAG